MGQGLAERKQLRSKKLFSQMNNRQSCRSAFGLGQNINHESMSHGCISNLRVTVYLQAEMQCLNASF